MTKHNYTVAEAPTNTGSISNPARFNWRMDCPTRGRFWGDVEATRRILACPEDWSTAEVMTKTWLPIVEHVLRAIEWGSAAEQTYCRQLVANLPKSDHLVERAKRLAARGILKQSMLPIKDAPPKA